MEPSNQNDTQTSDVESSRKPKSVNKVILALVATIIPIMFLVALSTVIKENTFNNFSEVQNYATVSLGVGDKVLLTDNSVVLPSLDRSGVSSASYQRKGETGIVVEGYQEKLGRKWWKVSFEDGLEGWVSEAWLGLTNNSPSEEPVEPGGGYGGGNSGIGGGTSWDPVAKPAETPLNTLTQDFPNLSPLLESLRNNGQLYVSIDGTTLINYAWGSYDVDDSPMWASATKPSSVIAFMQLVEDGKVSVNDYVSKYIDGFEKNGKGDVKIEHLLTHSGHLGGYGGPQDHIPWDQVIANISNSPMEPGSTPGKDPAYNPAGIWILAEITKNMLGEDFDKILKDKVYVPAGMNSSALGVPNNTRPGELWLNPAGGTIGPMWELGRFYEVMLYGKGSNGTNEIIGSDTLVDMTTLQSDIGKNHCWGYGFNLNCAEVSFKRYGNSPSSDTYGHNGATGVIAFADPEKNLVFSVIGANSTIIEALYQDLQNYASPSTPPTGSSKTDIDLDWSFAYSGGGPGEDYARGAACDDAGNCYVSGDLRSVSKSDYTDVAKLGDITISVPFTPGVGISSYLWGINSAGTSFVNKVIPNFWSVDIDVLKNGNPVMAGVIAGDIQTTNSVASPANGAYDASWLIADSDGRVQKVISFGSRGVDAINEIAVSDNDDVVVTGSFGINSRTGKDITFPDGSTETYSGGDQDVFVASFNQDGSFNWGKALKASGHEQGRGVSTLPNGNVLLCGEFDKDLTVGSNSYQTAGDADIFVIMYSQSGTPLWSRTFGSSSFDACRGIDPGADGSVVISGEFTGKLTLDSFELAAYNSNDQDIFVAVLSPENGSVLKATSFGSRSKDSGCEIETDDSGNIWCSGNAWSSINIDGFEDETRGATMDQFLVVFNSDLSEYKEVISSDGSARIVNFAIGLSENNGIVVGGLTGTENFGGTTVTSPYNDEDFFVAGFKMVE